LLFVQDVAFTHTLLLILAGTTMVSGALGAVAQNDLRRTLSFLIVSHIGFAIMGLGFFSTRGLAGTVFYIIEDIIVLTALFMVSGIVERVRGSGELRHLGGLLNAQPFLALLFLVPALSLSGIPPLSGFWAKLALIQAGLAGGHYLVIAVALCTSLLTLFTATKMWAEVFWKPLPHHAQRDGARSHPTPPRLMVLPLAVLALLVVLLGIGAGPVHEFTTAAATQLLNPDNYIVRVLGEQAAANK
jgi:multicomponent Na+:H+ antiporter subunit D